jgi:hypothetical protein
MKSQQIKSIVNDLIAEAKTTLEDFSGEAINWGDLSCIEVIDRGTDRPYQVLIEEASPDSVEFQQWIQEQVFERFNIEVEVKTEW